MSVDERSPKRQRRSYSPPSPAPALKSAFVAQHPHTPPPSVHMSPSWNAQTSSLQQGGVTFPTPPSTSGYQGHMTGRGSSSEGGIESGKGTPVESGEMIRKDGDGDVNMGGEVDAEHMRSDHERNGEGATPVVLPGLFKLPTKPIARQRPHPTQDLLEMYNLRDIQNSVRRYHPDTGVKINKLRKSYEGKLKDLGLPGKNKVTDSLKELESCMGPTWDLLNEDGSTLWESQHARAADGPMKNDMLASLNAALSLKPGRLPKAEHEHWKAQLAFDDAKPKAAAPTKTATSNFLKSTTGPLARKSAPASPRNVPGRPERTSKKRRYDDTSFEGYEEEGYSTGDAEDRLAGKRRKQQV